MLRSRTAHGRNHVKQCRHEANEEKDAQEQFRPSVQEEEETQRNNDGDDRIALSEGYNSVHQS